MGKCAFYSLGMVAVAFCSAPDVIMAQTARLNPPSSSSTVTAVEIERTSLVQSPAPGGAAGLLVRVLGQAHANAFAIEIVPTLSAPPRGR
jgi:hypothetical protein